MVFEGFWDLYFRRPHPSSNIKADKLKEWHTFINLSVPPAMPEPAEGEEAKSDKVKAAVRVRIPFKKEEPKEEEDGAEEAKSQKSARSRASRKSR